MTGAEGILWEILRGRGFEGLNFRRQAPLAGFIVDFLCPDLRLVIELDGGIHDLREVEDAARDERIRLAGYAVLRFRNNVFTTNPNIVLNAIRTHASSSLNHPPHPSGSAAHLLPQGEKGEEA